MRKGIKKCLLFMIICMFLLQYTFPVQAAEESGVRNTMTASSENALRDFQDVDGQILEDFEDREVMWICQEDDITVVACDTSSDDGKSIQEQILEDFEEEEVLGVFTEDNITVVSCKVKDESKGRVTSKSVSIDNSVYIDGLYSFKVRHEVTFAYGIPADGHIAQIMTGTARVVDRNGVSAYYPDTSSMTTKSSSGDPAIFTSGTDIYIRSSNQYFKSVAIQTFYYGSGKYE